MHENNRIPLPMGIKNVLFVCTGNSCRSVIAEGLFRKMIKDTNLDIDVASAGISAFPGGGATEEAIQVLKEEGVDMSGHRSRRTHPEMVQNAHVIFAMQKMHREFIVLENPGSHEKTFLLGDFIDDEERAQFPQEVADPIGSGVTTYEDTKAHIYRALQNILQQLKET